MKTIWKFRLQLVDQQQVLMPKGAEILSADLDNDNQMCVWALVDPSRSKHVRPIRIVGTGNPFEDSNMWKFIDTVPDYPLIWHVFEFGFEGPEVEENS